MRIILGLALSLTLLRTINAGFVDPDVDPVPTEPEPAPKPAPEPAPEPAPKPAPEPDPNPDTGSPSDGSSTPYGPPFPQDPGETGEDEPETDIGETLSDILDAITSIISEVVGGTTTVTSAAPLPTAAHFCLSAHNIYNSCALQTSGFDSAAATIQASCLCYQNQSTSSWVPGLFDGYLGGCYNYVQRQTQLATLTGLATAMAFCTTAGNVKASATATASATLAVPTAASTTAPQEPPSSKGAASALSPVMFSGSRNMVWWVEIALVGLAWTGYS